MFVLDLGYGMVSGWMELMDGKRRFVKKERIRRVVVD